MANNNTEAALASLNAKAQTICLVVAGRLGFKGWDIDPGTTFEELGASTDSIEDIVTLMRLTFDIEFDEDTETVAKSLIRVNDLIRKVVDLTDNRDDRWTEENETEEYGDSEEDEEDDDAEDVVYANEQEYFSLYQEYLNDYDCNIGPRERKRLEKERARLGLSME